MSPSVSDQVVILLADDDENDRELVNVALEPYGERICVQHVANGVECMAYLKGEGAYATAPAVDLLLLDINMPRQDGFSVMEELAATPSLRELPVVVLTTSSAPEDVHRMYGLRCSSYVIKPLEMAEFRRLMSTLVEYWLTVARLPSGKHFPGPEWLKN